MKKHKYELFLLRIHDKGYNNSKKFRTEILGCGEGKSTDSKASHG